MPGPNPNQVRRGGRGGAAFHSQPPLAELTAARDAARRPACPSLTLTLP